MSYDPDIHHRRSIRLKEYDYSLAGLYFVTVCVQNKQCLFGKITDDEMVLNDAGKMIEKWCTELSHKFPDIMPDTYIIMPNHFHAIIVNNGASPVGAAGTAGPVGPVGADLRVCPNIRGEHNDVQGEHNDVRGEHNDVRGEHAGSPLHAVVQWFKTMTTNEYIRGVKTLGWQPFDKKLWQRNYYEHIIRNDNSYQNIADYIACNPAKWQSDKFYTE
jgi:REP element-mobilizing transposase RayT